MQTFSLNHLAKAFCGPHSIYPETSSLRGIPIGTCGAISGDGQIAFEPCCSELNDSLKRAGLRKEMSCA